MGICYLALYKPMLFLYLIIWRIISEASDSSRHTKLLCSHNPCWSVDFSAAYKYANLQDSRILGFFSGLARASFLWPFFIQLSDLSIQLYIVGVSLAVLTVQKNKERKKEERELWLMKKEKVQPLHSLYSSLVNLSIICLELAYVLAPQYYHLLSCVDNPNLLIINHNLICSC